ncbi:hypothetical protein ZWY2020_023465 [Hordeum vulgare]|nr:hypothetical protein ZWY2020_023465 [Hordeum vulgare]
MARARCAGGRSAPARALLLLVCALLCAIALVAVVPLAAPPGEGTARLPSTSVSSSSFQVAAGGRRAFARSGRSRARRWNSAGLVDSKHEVPSGPNPDSNR